MATITLKNLGKYSIKSSTYPTTGNTAILLISEEFPWDTIKLSLNLAERIPSDEFVVKNYSENTGIPEQVFTSGFFEDTGKTYSLPFGGTCPIWKIIKPVLES